MSDRDQTKEKTTKKVEKKKRANNVSQEWNVRIFLLIWISFLTHTNYNFSIKTYSQRCPLFSYVLLLPTHVNNKFPS